MKTLFHTFWRTYKKGVRWLTTDPQDELFVQLTYVAMVISEVSLLWLFGYDHAIAFTFATVGYLCILYFFGWMKDFNEGSILQGSYKEEYYRNAYWLLSTLLWGVTVGYCRTPVVFLLFIAPFVMTFIFFFLRILCDDAKAPAGFRKLTSGRSLYFILLPQMLVICIHLHLLQKYIYNLYIYLSRYLMIALNICIHLDLYYMLILVLYHSLCML